MLTNEILDTIRDRRVSHRLLQEVQIRHPKGSKLESVVRTAFKRSRGVSYEGDSKGLKATVLIEVCVGTGDDPSILAHESGKVRSGSNLMIMADEEEGYPDIVGVVFEDDMLPNPNMAKRLRRAFDEKIVPDDWDVVR